VINSPNLHDFLQKEDANFYNTAEKQGENQGKTVLFYSDGFKRSHFNENLYIYNPDQANYQSLSKFSRKFNDKIGGKSNEKYSEKSNEKYSEKSNEKYSEKSNEKPQKEAKKNFNDLAEFRVENAFFEGIPAKNNKFDSKISESAEFRIDESMNDREIERINEDLGINEENEEDLGEKIEENGDFIRKSVIFQSLNGGNIPMKKGENLNFFETF